MKTFIIENNEKERIKFLYESKGIILNEDGIWGFISRAARRVAGQSEDDFIRALKTTEAALAKSLDDIVSKAMKSKNITELDDLQAKLMHTYNPSNAAEGIQEAKNLVIKFLNGYSKSKGKSNWKEIRDEVRGVQPQTNPQGQSQTKPQGQSQTKPNDDHVQFRENPLGGIFGNKLSGSRISNRSFGRDTEWYSMIDWSKIRNAKNMEDYNKIIARAIKTNDFQYISSGGFEKLLITDFRKFLQNNISKVHEVDPLTGRWSVNFK